MPKTKLISLFVILGGIFLTNMPHTAFAATTCYDQLTQNDSTEYNRTTDGYTNAFIPSVDCAIDTIGFDIATVNGTGGATVIKLYADGASQPGALLETCSTPTLVAGWATSTCSGTTNLTAGTQYWISMESSLSATNYTKLRDKYTGTTPFCFQTAGVYSCSTVINTTMHIEGHTPSGGGAGGGTTNYATSTVGETERNLALGWYIFLATMFFVVWTFKKR